MRPLTPARTGNRPLRGQPRQRPCALC